MREGEGDEEERDGESARCKGGDTLCKVARWKRRALAAGEDNSTLAGGVSERARAREGESEGEETGRRESTQGCPVSPAAAPPPPAPSTGAGAPSAAAARTRGGSSTPATVDAVAGPHCPLSTLENVELEADKRRFHKETSCLQVRWNLHIAHCRRRGSGPSAPVHAANNTRPPWFHISHRRAG